MKKKILSLLAITLCVVLAALAFTACGESKSASPLVGSWESDEAAGVIYDFKDDGTGALKGEGYEMSFTYTVKDDTLTFVYTGSDSEQTFNYKIENNVLSIIDPEGATITYTKE